MSIAWQIPSLTKSSCLHFGQKKWCGLLHSLMECSLPLWVPFLKTCQTTRLNKWGARKLMSFHYSRLFATVLWHVWELSRITVNSRSHSPWCHLQGFKVWPVQQAVQAVIQVKLRWHRFLTTCSSCNIYSQYVHYSVSNFWTWSCTGPPCEPFQDCLAHLYHSPPVHQKSEMAGSVKAERLPLWHNDVWRVGLKELVYDS